MRDDIYNSQSRVRMADEETLDTLPSEGEAYLARSEEKPPRVYSQYRSSTDGVRRSGDYEIGTYRQEQAYYVKNRNSPGKYRENPRFSGEGEYVGSGERRGISPTGKAFSQPLEAAIPTDQLLSNEYWENLNRFKSSSVRFQRLCLSAVGPGTPNPKPEI